MECPGRRVAVACCRAATIGPTDVTDTANALRVVARHTETAKDRMKEQRLSGPMLYR